MRLALLAIAVVLVLAGCGGGGKSAKSTTQTVTTTTVVSTTTSTQGGGTVVTHGRYHYPEALTTNYMKSCVAGGNAKKRAYCACTLDKLSNNVSTGDFARIGLSGGKVPPRIRRLIRRATVACAHKQ